MTEHPRLATFDPGTLQVFVSDVQGVRDEAVDHPATLQGYTGSQIDALAPALVAERVAPLPEPILRTSCVAYP